MTFDQACERLRIGKGSIRCDEVISILESLGFVVRRGSSGKHHTYIHPAFPIPMGANFNCPHRAGDPVLKSYVTRILGVLRHYESEIKDHLGEQ